VIEGIGRYLQLFLPSWYYTSRAILESAMPVSEPTVHSAESKPESDNLSDALTEETFLFEPVAPKRGESLDLFIGLDQLRDAWHNLLARY
jgi:hypothetical protein